MNVKLLIIGTCIVINANGWSQTGNPPPTGYPSTPAAAVTNANFAWYRGGNLPGGTAGTNNILGTRWNSDIWLMTNSNVMAHFTHNNALFGLNANGDGLELINRQPSLGPPGIGNIAIFTSPGFTNGTEIRMGVFGNIV